RQICDPQCAMRKTAVCLAGLVAGACMTTSHSASKFPALVDDYLEQFSRRHPWIAAGNGLHAHDDALEDFSAEAIAAEIQALRATRASLDALDAATLSPDEAVDRRILQGIVDGWLLDLDGVKTWTRNPMISAPAISAGAHNLMTMESSPPDARAQQAIAKLRGVPKLLAAARANLRTPPRAFVERGIVMFKGAAGLLDKELPLAFADINAPLKFQLGSAAADAKKAIEDYTAELESKVLPNASGAFAIGTAAVEARYRAEELIDTPAAALLTIGDRELKKVQQEFTAAAAKVDPKRGPLEVWRDVLR